MNIGKWVQIYGRLRILFLSRYLDFHESPPKKGSFQARSDTTQLVHKQMNWVLRIFLPVRGMSGMMDSGNRVEKAMVHFVSVSRCRLRDLSVNGKWLPCCVRPFAGVISKLSLCLNFFGISLLLKNRNRIRADSLATEILHRRSEYYFQANTESCFDERQAF